MEEQKQMVINLLLGVVIVFFLLGLVVMVGLISRRSVTVDTAPSNVSVVEQLVTLTPRPPTEIAPPTQTLLPLPSATTVPSTNTPQPSPTPLMPGNWIAFVSQRDGNADIYLMRPDGSAQTNLTNHPAFDYDPAWSPDGQRIAFVSQRDGNREIFIMNYDGSDLINLTNHANDDYNPVWASDGERLAFVSERYEGLPGIYILDLISGEVTKVPSIGFSIEIFTWLQESNQIVYVAIQHSGVFFYQQNINGNDRRLIENFGYSLGSGFTWSPDESRIAFFEAEPGTQDFDIFTMNSYGDQLTNLTNNDVRDVQPAWSPDAHRLVFASEIATLGDLDLYLINVDGSGLLQLTDAQGDDYDPVWSPQP